ncbi:DUF1080 domain-containing protein [Planctomyces sp. SH-PL14]|uniref:3-keto-disaccharide hydrolase n=1 Tax=Planctomyces sp. SH-PL14 TaxID=1632864 RepID=UPI0018D3D30B|nr:DUF1080 domain-containing protein [Planctomyces sp. SH-PL14]
MNRRIRLLLVSCCVLFSGSRGSAARADAAPGVAPTSTVRLVNGKDLGLWYTWLTDDRYEDPRGVFTILPDGILRISGDGFGGLITKQEYRDYHLVMEYRWGTATWRTRKDKARDGGLLLHCQGPDGNFGGSAAQPGPWMTSVECQIIEGGVGDILVLQGKDAEGKTMEAAATSRVTRDRDGEPAWAADGKAERFTKGRINWFGRDPDWKDALGYRGKSDPDSPGQEWTTLECFCRGDTLVYRVNGVVVNRASEVLPRQGKILLQTEGAEMFVRKLELRPLPAPDQIP